MGFIDKLLEFTKTLPTWYWIVLGIIALLLIGTKFVEDRYIAEEKNKVLLEYGVDTSRGDKLVTCDDGSYDSYKPRNIEQGKVTTLCGKLLNDATRAYLDSLN